MAKEDERSLARREGGREKEVRSELDISSTDLETIQDPDLDELMEILSQPTQALSTDDYIASIARRQEVVSKHLLRGGADRLRRFFELVKQRDQSGHPVKLDLSMLEISGKLLSGLYLPGANLEKLIISDSDLTGSNLYAANLRQVVGAGAIMRGVIATGSVLTDAVFPGADFSGARLIGCTFINSVLTDVIVDRDTNLAGARFIGTHLGGTDIESANTVGATFRGIRR